MALSDPVWRVKTRPCPFYQQGRCLFEDSCNFMHTVSVKSSSQPDTISITLEPGTPTKPPPITVHSPRSVRSPPRSPRLSGLLLALKDVIGEDPDDDYDEIAETTYVEALPNETDVTVKVTDADFEPPLSSSSEEEQALNAPLENLTEIPNIITATDDKVLHVSDNSEAQSSTPIIENSSDEPRTPPKPITSTILSPMDLSQIYLGVFTQVSDESTKLVPQDGDFIDSGYVETWKSPFASSASPPCSPLKSTFGVLSSPFTATSSRVISPRLTAFISRPPQSPFVRLAVVDDDVPSDLSLDSPAGGICADTEVEPSEEYIVVEEDAQEGSDGMEDDVGDVSEEIQQVEQDEQEGSYVTEDDTEDVPGEIEQNLDDDQYADEGSSFASSSWEDQANPTVVFLGMPPVTPEEVSVAIQQSKQTPTHFLTEVIEFDESDAVASSSTPESLPSPLADPPSPTSDAGSGDDTTMDYTARLAYLASPALVNENDTLQFLYDHYSDFPEITEEPMAYVSASGGDLPPSIYDNVDDEPLPLSAATPVRSGFTRDRVFTPPPTATRSRSGTVTAPVEVRSPVSSQGAFSQSRPSSRSQSARSAWSPDSAESELPDTVSSKVPFGFRKSATQGRASGLASGKLSKPSSSVVDPPPVTTSRKSTLSPDRSSPNSPVAGGLRPLRLSSILTKQPYSAPSRNSTFPVPVNSYRQPGNLHRSSISSASVLSDKSYSRNPLLLSTVSSSIPEHIRNSLSSADDIIPSPLSSYHLRSLATFESPHSAPISHPSSWRSNPRAVIHPTPANFPPSRPSSRASELSWHEEEEDQEDTMSYEHTVRYAIPAVPHSAPISQQRTSVIRQARYSVAAPRPTLMFAIASDNVQEVQRVLESGEADPNDLAGPQSALEFTLTNDQLENKIDIVKTLLAFGADPKTVTHQSDSSSLPTEGPKEETVKSVPSSSLIASMDPATRYYIERADASHTRRTSALIHRSFFRPLTRVRYEMIGQDWALEQLFKDLSIHSRQLSVTPIVVLLCGPSGHGKSLLARKFGSLLGVPTHTVDMPTIHSVQDLWKSYSMSPFDPPSTRTLAEFLIDNEGKRCVVVLDEIEKTHEKSSLWALLMPWEHGRCTFEANGRLVDVRNVVWLSTSNIGQELIFEHHYARALPAQLMSREEYTELMGLLRPRVSERLGTSMLSRVTTVLPFVPFTPEEKRAICYEALHTIAGDVVKTLAADVVDSMVEGAIANYTAAEGARSLYRAVSNQLVDNI